MPARDLKTKHLTLLFLVSYNVYGVWLGGIYGVRSVENVECGKCGVWKMRYVENSEYRKCGVWKIRSVENTDISVMAGAKGLKSKHS